MSSLVTTYWSEWSETRASAYTYCTSHWGAYMLAVSGVKKHFLYRGTSLTRKRISLGSYCRPMPRVLGGSSSRGSGIFLWARYPCRRSVPPSPFFERETCVALQGYLPHKKYPPHRTLP